MGRRGGAASDRRPAARPPGPDRPPGRRARRPRRAADRRPGTPRGCPDAAVAAARAGAPTWLADELARAWAGYGRGLADALDAAAVEPAPTPDELRGLDVPVGLVALVGDAVHPVTVARRWHGLLPRAALRITDLDTFGADPAAPGRAAVDGWARAGRG